MESNTTPTIAELWSELKYKDNRFARKHLEELDGVDFDALRAQLLERCEKAGFSVNANGSLNVPDFYGSADDADEYIACMSAVQWEARQREKEARA